MFVNKQCDEQTKQQAFFSKKSTDWLEALSLEEDADKLYVDPGLDLKTLESRSHAICNRSVTATKSSRPGFRSWKVALTDGAASFKPRVFDRIEVHFGSVAMNKSWSTLKNNKLRDAIVTECGKSFITIVETVFISEAAKLEPRSLIISAILVPQKSLTRKVEDFLTGVKSWYMPSIGPHTALLKIGFNLDSNGDATESKKKKKKKKRKKKAQDKENEPDPPIAALVPSTYKCRGKSFMKLNPSQKSAVQTALSGQFLKDPLHLIHGPPGTGKTTTLGCLLEEIAIEGKLRVLCVVPTHKGMDRLIGAARQSGVNPKVMLRLGHPVKIAEENLSMSLYYREKAEIRKLYKSGNLAEVPFIESRLINAARFIFGTPLACNKEMYDCFDLVIVDEASQLTTPHTWMALQFAKRAILTGDPYQLAPVVKSNRAKALGIDVTLMDVMLKRNRVHSTLLNVQYRMNAEILRWSNASFYDNRVTTPKDIINRRLKCSALGASKSGLLFIDTKNDPNARESASSRSAGKANYANGKRANYGPNAHSTSNPGEADVVRRVVNLLGNAGVPLADIKVICPYSRQRAILDVMLPKIEVGTIDSFQGREADVIVISMTRSNPNKIVGFLKDARRLNVALTRAKKLCVIVGDSRTLSSNKTIAGIIESVKGNVLTSKSIK